MTQIFNITIDSVLQDISKCNISEEVNRFYDIATFEMQTEPALEADVLITFGDRTFSGFIYKTTKISRLLYKVECRTQGAKLSEPYSPYTEGYDAATTSHDLCTLYTANSGVPINITAANLSFDGSYERRGNMLSALQNIANTTGAEFWDDGTTIQIQPNKAITEDLIEDSIEIAPIKIMNFVATTNSVHNKGVGYITIRNGGSITDDIISHNKIYAEIDECTGEIFVYPNPNGELESTQGMSELTYVLMDRQETINVLDDNVVRVDGAVSSVSSVKLNGVSIGDYNISEGHNVIYFSTPKRGALTITYKAHAYRGFTNISVTPSGRFISIDIFYLDQVIQFAGFLSPNCDNNSATDGDMTCIVPNEMYYNAGFDVWTIGGDPEFTFYNKNVELTAADIGSVPTSVADDYISVERATLEETATGYRYQTRYDVDDDLGATSAGVDISYTTSTEDGYSYFNFTTYYPDVKVSYETDAIRHTVQFSTITNGVITMVIRNKNTDKICEYLLDTKIPCELNQYIPINVSELLNVPVVDIAGITLNYVDPSLADKTATINSFGIVKIYVTVDGKYVIDTSGIKPRTTITLTANVNG